jgi:hypothetical protein
MLAGSVTSSGWECEKCPRRDVALFDLDVRVPQPGPGDSLSIADWLRLFLVAGGVHDKLVNEDPSKSCISFYDGQLASKLNLEEQDYSLGLPSNLPPPGPVEDTDYLVSGFVTGSGAGYVVHVRLEAGVTRELVAAGSAPVDLENINASGKQAAEALTPLMEKIREFQRKKRDEDNIYAIYPKMEVTPKKKKIKTEESTEVTIKLNDCDDFALKDRKVKLSATLGRFEPQEVTIDENGEAEATFIAGNKAGWAKLTADWDWKYPCGHGPFLCSEGAAVSIDRPADVWVIKATLSQLVNSMAEKTESIAQVTVEADHPLLKPGTYRITKKNSLRDSMSGSATIHMIVRVDASESEFVYSGETPIILMVYGNVSKSDKEERVEYINRQVSEFSQKRTDTFNGSFNLGSFEFHYTPEYQYVSASATSEGQLQTKIMKYEDEQWKTEPYSTKRDIGIYGGCSSDEGGCSITRSKSGYSFSYSKTETERKENQDFGTITTVTTITLNGTISPLKNQ